MTESSRSNPFRSREMALPQRTLVALRRSLRGEVGPLSTVHALHSAGFETGEEMWTRFSGSLGEEDPNRISLDRFWSVLRTFFARRGWGNLEHRVPHPAFGLLSSADWVEADGDASELQPSCSFTCGLLSSLLSGAGGGPVAVLEIRCRSRGDDRCDFVFGSENAVHDLYGILLDGAEFDEAIQSL